MGTDNKVAEIIKATEGLVKAVPIYDDLIQPAAKEVGKSLKVVGQTINLILAPLKATIWGYEKISNFVEIAVSARICKLPKSKIVNPNPAIAGPALEALRFVGDNQTLRELYANLLASTIDSDTAKNCHPSFVKVLEQLTSDEAKILCKGYCTSDWNWFVPFISLHEDMGEDKGKAIFLDTFTIIEFESGCDCPELIKTYLDNFLRLGLIKECERVFPGDALLKGLEIMGVKNSPSIDILFDNLYKTLESHSTVVDILKQHKEIFEKLDKPKFYRDGYILTEYGRHFGKACVRNYEH